MVMSFLAAIIFLAIGFAAGVLCMLWWVDSNLAASERPDEACRMRSEIERRQRSGTDEEVERMCKHIHANGRITPPTK